MRHGAAGHPPFDQGRRIVSQLGLRLIRWAHVLDRVGIFVPLAYLSAMRRSFLPASALASLLAVLPLANAVAGEKPKSGALPGVETDYRIVKPAPEPDDRSEAEVEQDRKHFKVGNWDVQVSGYVWYQVGASSGR